MSHSSKRFYQNQMAFLCDRFALLIKNDLHLQKPFPVTSKKLENALNYLEQLMLFVSDFNLILLSIAIKDP